MISEPIHIVLSLIAGAGVGSLYFAVLWLTIRTMPLSQKPWRVGFVGGAGRLCILMLCVAGFIFFKMDAFGMMLWLLGFSFARFAIVSKFKLTHDQTIKMGA